MRPERDFLETRGAKRHPVDESKFQRVNKGHIVPKCYQRNFASRTQVMWWAADGSAGQTLRNIESVCRLGPFYRRVRADGMHVDDVEHLLSGIESEVAPAFARIRENRAVDPVDKAVLARFFGFQLARTPAFYRTRSGLVQELISSLPEDEFRQQALVELGSEEVRNAVTVIHESDVSAAIERRFAGNLSRGATVLPATDCDEEARTSALGGSTSSARRSARAARAAAPRQPREVADYTSNNYSPPFIRVRTQLDDENDRHKMTVAWKYSAVTNLSYWRSKYRRSGVARGTEVQVEMNQDGDDEAFGYPWWYNNVFDRDPAPANQAKPTTGIWNANFRCAYPDDYYKDSRPYLSITIGMACRPNNIYHRYRWAHFLTHAEDNDRITVSAVPGHYAKDDHGAASLPGLPDPSEETYCEVRGKRLGSCMFSDHGPAARKYRLNADARSAVTPSNVVFRRTPNNE